MTNYEFLREYFRLQDGVLTDKLVEYSNFILGYNATDPSPFMSSALTNVVLGGDDLQIIEQEFVRLNRAPTTYSENSPRLNKLIDLLISKGYKKKFEDCWLFYGRTPTGTKYFDAIKEVASPKELNIFLDTLDKCYSADDPDNPYGALGKYLEAAKVAWLTNANTERIQYYLAYKQGRPVAVSALTNYHGLGFISNVGSLKEVRGQGYGKAATFYAISESLKNGNYSTFLATESDGYPLEFYKKLGFKNKFCAVGMTKEE